MADFTHKNTIKYVYSDGGTTISKEISRSESDGAQIQVSQAVTTDASTETTVLSIPGFEFALANTAKSVYIRLDGFDGTLKGGAGGTTTMVALEDGIPYVWSNNSGNNFPQGATNPMKDSTDALKIHPDAGAGTSTAGTLVVKVLYNPE